MYYYYKCTKILFAMQGFFIAFILALVFVEETLRVEKKLNLLQIEKLRNE